MSRLFLPNPGGFSPSRRRFVTGLAAGGALMGLGLAPSLSRASGRSDNGPETLAGSRFDLTYSPTPVNFTGQDRFATAINGSVPAPVLRFKEGDTVSLTVNNRLAEDTSIHWHGLILPPDQDGVPGISFPGIKPGESFTYQFPIIQSGTYWYHSHSGFQEQTGAYGAIIIDPSEPEPFSYDRDYVVMLSDWSDEDPNAIYAKLKKLSHYYNTRERTLGETIADLEAKGWDGFMADRAMWNEMRMSDRDISDVTGYTYTYLMNGNTPAEGWKGLFKRGERVRLRFINAAAMTFFDVRIPGLKMTVVAADGQYVEPVTVDEFRIGVAETYDVLVEPADDRAYTVFAQSIDRSGYARGTLTPDMALAGEVPAMDEAPILGHADMGMDMSAMGHGAHGGGAMKCGASMPGMNHGSQRTMDHSGHDMSGANPFTSGNTAPKCGAQSNGAMKCGGSMAGMAKARHEVSRDSLPGVRPVPAITMGTGKAGHGSAQPVVHAETEFGPHVDMRADAPMYRIDDPGIGLRGSTRRVLTYADLRNLNPTPDPREPEREINLHLTGNMSRYMWSVNGIKFADSEPLHLTYGERVRINLINDTMMNHPMHLHGMWSDLETGDPDYIPRKHTVIVQPGAKASYLVTADARGSWAYHCHLIFHMLGMFRKVTVS